jgi:hypothetical protein
MIAACCVAPGRSGSDHSDMARADPRRSFGVLSVMRRRCDAPAAAGGAE